MIKRRKMNKSKRGIRKLSEKIMKKDFKMAALLNKEAEQ